MKKTLLLVFAVIVAARVYAASPTISSFTPSSGAVGTLVTITGTNLGSPTTFNIGGKAAIVISNTGSKLVGMVMPGAATGGITITTSGGTANSGSNFTVVATSYPSVQQGGKLAGAGNIGTGNSDDSSLSVAISADGNTAVLGEDYDNAATGAIYIFVRSGSTWTQQAKLSGSGYTGSEGQQGHSVAISADGNTVIEGADEDNAGLGSAWIFSRSGTSWTQQAHLTGSGGVGSPSQGSGVAISGDGNTAAIGGPYDNAGKGAIWVFTRSGSTWTQQGNKLSPTGGIGQFSFMGQSLSLSADGKTLAGGGPFDNATEGGTAAGAVWIFARNGSTWTQQAKLSGTGAIGNTVYQGISVALSADGNTMIEGGEGDNTNLGAAWIFTRNGTAWSQQTKLVGTGNTGASYQGYGTSLSADGNTAAVGGPGDNTFGGAIWVYTRSGSTWSQKGQKLVGSGNTGSATQGYGVALSGDGRTMMEGALWDNAYRGAAWIFVSGTVQQQPQTINNFANTAVSAPYGTPDIAPGATASSGLTVVYSSSNTAVATIVNGKVHIAGAGTATITASQPGDAAYLAATPISRTLTVTKASLTITADNQTRYYTTANPTFTVTYSGFKNGDTQINTAPTVTTTATASSPVGTYPITVSGGSSTNYTLKYVAGTLTVKALTQVPYTTTDFNPVPSITGVIYTTNNSAVATVVSNKIHLVGVGIVTITGTKSGQSQSTPIQVTPGQLTLTADNKTKTVGSANPALTVTYSGFKSGDSNSGFASQPTVSTTATTSSPVGTYPITVSGGSSTKYTFKYVAGTLTVKASANAVALNIPGLTINDNMLIYPNPASVSANVQYKLPQQSDVVISVYGKNGKLLNTYKASAQAAGSHSSQLVTDQLTIGWYVVTVSAKGYSKIGKLIVQ